uniref:Uncharacterized protein n=1 Tax=Nicotiana tabacum TaxID=4097 RepID=A0A1S4DRM0_TOBAC|nr:PREDICTED: uncharacterized protein LOC107832730 [Nicotiana tabacum]
MPYLGNPQVMTGMYTGNPIYQLPAPYSYQPGFSYPQYRFPAYGPDYVYPQMYGVPGPQILQYQRPNTNGARTKNVPVMQLPYNSVKLLDYPVSSGITMSSPRQSQIVVQAHPSQFTQRSGSDQMAG